MGWNGSYRRGGSTPVKPKVTAKKPSPIRGVVAGLVVVAAAVAVFLFLFSGVKGTVEIKVSNPAKIKESKPAKVQKAEAPKKVKKVKVVSKAIKIITNKVVSKAKTQTEHQTAVIQQRIVVEKI